MPLLEEHNPEEEVETLLPNTNIITHCIYTHDCERLQKSFDNEEDAFREDAINLVNENDSEGRTPLDLAAILGREDIITLLVEKGANILHATDNGYTALHYAAAWGKVGVLKTLVEHAGDMKHENKYREKARDTALRYYHTECVDYLDWAEARSELVNAVKKIQDIMADPEQIHGRLIKEDKVMVINLIKEKNEWLEKTPDATTQNFLDHKCEVDELLEPIYTKLREPRPEPTVKKKR